MPTALPKACLEPRCPNYAVKNGRCEAHAKEHGKQLYKDRNVTDLNHWRYQTPAWKRLTKAFRAQNPICLAIDHNGQQCTHAAQMVHHRIAVEVRPDLFLDPKNLAALCNHHHGHTVGDPEGARYAPAVFKSSMLPGINQAEPNYSIAPPPPIKIAG